MAVCRRKRCKGEAELRGLCGTHAIQSNKPFGNPEFKGNGKTKCYVCGLPVVEHSISQYCPFMDPLDVHKGLRSRT